MLVGIRETGEGEGEGLRLVVSVLISFHVFFFFFFLSFCVVWCGGGYGEEMGRGFLKITFEISLIQNLGYTVQYYILHEYRMLIIIASLTSLFGIHDISCGGCGVAGYGTARVFRPFFCDNAVMP